MKYIIQIISSLIFAETHGLFKGHVEFKDNLNNK